MNRDASSQHIFNQTPLLQTKLLAPRLEGHKAHHLIMLVSLKVRALSNNSFSVRKIFLDIFASPTAPLYQDVTGKSII